MKPWHNEVMEEWDDDAIEALYNDCEPGDFYFAKSQLQFDESKDFSVVITPAEYFDEHGYCFDQSLLIDHLLPEYLQESHEGSYRPEAQGFLSGEYPWETVRGNLLARGFRQSTAFSSFIKAQDHELEDEVDQRDTDDE